MAFVADGLDGAVLGVGRRCGQPDVVVYSRDRCVEIMMGQGMSRPEAVECLEFNTFGAWVGDQTPVWVDEMSAEEVHEHFAIDSAPEQGRTLVDIPDVEWVEFFREGLNEDAE